jgi:hypothetical protein
MAHMVENVRKMQGALTALKVAEAEAALGPSPLLQERSPGARAKKEFIARGNGVETPPMSIKASAERGRGLDDALNMSNPLAGMATKTTPSSNGRAAHAGLAAFARPQARSKTPASRGATRSSALDDDLGANNPLRTPEVNDASEDPSPRRGVARGASSLDNADGVNPLRDE